MLPLEIHPKQLIVALLEDRATYGDLRWNSKKMLAQGVTIYNMFNS